MKNIIIASLLLLTTNAYAFEKFLIKAAEKHNVLKEVQTLISNQEITKTQSTNDRITLGNIQLSIEESLAECIKKQECMTTRVAIKTPFPSTPLRAEEKNINKVSGINNKQINNILLARKKALLSIVKEDNNFLLISYKKDGDKAINYKSYKELTKKFNNIVDCQGCYEFFKENNSYASYDINTKDNKKITVAVYNTQLLEKNSQQEIKVTYKIEKE